MANDIRILIDAGLNYGSSIKNINDGIKALSKSKSLQTLSLKVNVDTSFIKSIDGFIQATQKLNKALDQQNKVVNETTQTIKHLDGSIEKVTQRHLANGEVITKTNKQIDENTKRIQDETKAFNDQAKTLKQLEKELEGYGRVRSKVNQNKAGEITGYTNTYQNAAGTKVTVNTDANNNVKNYNQVSDYIKQQQEMTRVANEETKIRTRIAEDAAKAERKIAQDREAMDKAHYQALKQNEKVNNDYKKSLEGMSNKLAIALSNYQNKGNKEAVDGIKELQSRLTQFAETKNVANYKTIMQQLNSEFNKLTTNAKVSGQSVNNLGNQFSHATKKVAIWLGATQGVFAPIRLLRSGIQDIYEMDKAMTNLMKVTDETDATYKKFIQTSSSMADSIGNTTLNLVKSSGEWARLGYDIQTAQNMAKTTLMYQNVGDIKTPEDASLQLIASIKGFGIEVDKEANNVARVVDIYNEVGNKFAISTDGIGQAVQRSASSLSEAGNTIEESVALITAANTTVQNPAKVGNALKTLSMRLRGVDEDGSAVDGLLPSLEEKFNSIGLTLKKDEKTFKNTYEIFSDLHSVWDKLSDIQRADVLELVAGKMQGNIAASMIENWNDAEGALQAGLNSFGSAAKENASFLESMQGHIAKFKNAVSDYWGNSASREFLNAIIDAGTKAVKMLGNLGRTVGIVGGFFIAFKSKAIVETTVGLYKFIAGLFATKAAIDTTESSASRAAKTMTLFQRSLGVIGLAVGAVSLLVAVMSQVNSESEKMNETIEKTNSKFEKLTNELQDATSYYKENYNEINNNSDVKNKLFELQNKLIDTYGIEASGLDLVNGKYEEQIQTLEKLQDAKLNDEISENQIAVDVIKDKKYSDPNLGYKLDGFLSYFGKGDTSYRVQDGAGFGDLGVEEYYEKLLKLQDGIQAKNTEIFTSSQLIPKNSIEWQNALDAVNGKLEEIAPLVKVINKLEELKKNQIENSTLAQEKYNDTQKDLFSTVSKSLSKLPTEQFRTVLSEASKEIKNFDGTNLDKVISSVTKLGSLNGNPEVVQSLFDITKNSTKAADGMYYFGGAAASASEDAKKYADEVNDTISEIGELNDTLYNLSKGQSMSANEMNNLILKYPQLANNVKKLKDGYTIEKSALETLKKTKVDYFKTLDQLGQKEVIGNKQALIDKMKIWGIEIETLTTLAQLNAAKAQVDMKVAAEIEVEDWTGHGVENQGMMNKFKKDMADATDPYKDLLDRIYELNNSFKTMVSSLDDVGSARDKDTKSTNKANDSYSETNEVLTELQKKLQKVQESLDTLYNKRKNLEKGSAAYRKSIIEENKLLQQKADLLDKGIADPSQLVSTKVTTTSKTSEDSSSTTITSSSSSGNYSGKYANFINKYAAQNGVDPNLVAAIIQQESSFNPNVVSKAGAVGLMQLMPDTARGLGVTNSYDPEQNIAGGTKYIAMMLQKFNGNVEHALAAYNAGPNRVQKWVNNGQINNIPFSETKNYLTKVLGYYSSFSGSSSPSSSSTSKSSKSSSSGPKTSTKAPSESDKTTAKENAKKERGEITATIRENQYNLIDDWIIQFENAIDKVQNKIEKSANKQSNMYVNSDEWRKEEQSQISYIEQQRKLREDEIKKVKELMKQKKITSQEYNKQIADIEAQMLADEAEIYTKRENVIESFIGSYNDKLAEQDNTLSVSEANLKMMTEGTVEYNNELRSQIPIIEEKNKIIGKEADYIKYLLASGKLNAEQTVKYTNLLKELNLTMLENNSTIQDITNTLKDLRESAADNIIEEYKKVIEKQRDLALDAIDQEREKEDKRHEERTKNLDEEQKQFENYINARLKALDRENASTDYGEELQKKMDERQKVQDKLNIYAMDNTMEGKAKRKELTEQLAAIDEEIRIFQRDRERELIKQGLQDQLNDHKEYNDELKDEEDKLHDDTLDKLDEEKKKTERKYKDILEDQKKFYDLKKGLMSNDAIVVTATLGIIGGEYDKLFANIKDHTFETSQEMQNMINDLQTSLEGLNKFKIGDYTPTESGSGGSGNNTGSGSTGTIKGTTAARVAWTHYLGNKKEAEDIKKQMATLDKKSAEYKKLTDDFNKLKANNDQLRSVYGFPDGSYKDLVGQKIFSAETGGMTPAWGPGGKLLMAHEKEMILNKADTSNILQVVDITRSIVDSFSRFNLSTLIPKSNVANTQQPNIKNDIKVEIYPQAHQNPKDISEEVMNKLTRRGF